MVISKLIVNKFQGEIFFTSVFNKGSTFTFTFEVQNPTDEQIDEHEDSILEENDEELMELQGFGEEAQDIIV